MYNRYIPQPDGSHRREAHRDQPANPRPEPQEPPPAPPCQPASRQGGGAADFLHQLLPKDLDTGDLLIIVLLLLIAGDHPEGRSTALLTLALYLMMQD